MIPIAVPRRLALVLLLTLWLRRIEYLGNSRRTSIGHLSHEGFSGACSLRHVSSDKRKDETFGIWCGSAYTVDQTAYTVDKILLLVNECKRVLDSLASKFSDARNLGLELSLAVSEELSCSTQCVSETSIDAGGEEIGTVALDDKTDGIGEVDSSRRRVILGFPEGIRKVAGEIGHGLSRHGRLLLGCSVETLLPTRSTGGSVAAGCLGVVFERLVGETCLATVDIDQEADVLNGLLGNLLVLLHQLRNEEETIIEGRRRLAHVRSDGVLEVGGLAAL
ncbi:hypothetical protein HG531_000287 [Fusarium graminearum]|nr:hypothetical protein HG531_000287 [Fusarium graminearum]